MQGYGGNLSKAYLKANMIAGEAVSNMRTVAAFCSEEKVLDLYSRELVDPANKSFTRGQIAGLFYGISQFFIFSSYGLALWYVPFHLLNFFDSGCQLDSYGYIHGLPLTSLVPEPKVNLSAYAFIGMALY